MRTQHNVQVRQVVVLPAKNVAQVTADYRIGVSAANTICGIKRRGLDGLSSIFPRYGGLETILALRARGREYWPQREGGGRGAGGLAACTPCSWAICGLLCAFRGIDRGSKALLNTPRIFDPPTPVILTYVQR